MQAQVRREEEDSDEFEVRASWLLGVVFVLVKLGEHTRERDKYRGEEEGKWGRPVCLCKQVSLGCACVSLMSHHPSLPSPITITTTNTQHNTTQHKHGAVGLWLLVLVVLLQPEDEDEDLEEAREEEEDRELRALAQRNRWRPAAAAAVGGAGGGEEQEIPFDD